MNIIFNKSIKILIVTLLVLTVFFNKEKSQWMMIIAVSIWVIVILSGLFGKPFLHLLKTCFRAIKKQSVLPEPSALEAADNRCESLLLTQEENLRNDRMLQHIALRISEKLKSAYPKATWEWKDTPSLEQILNGITVRILVENMEAFTHADICFDHYGRIHIEPMTIGSFAASSGHYFNIAPVDEENPKVIDVRVWYQLIGQEILDKTITELNANGHSKLTIKENGDITIMRQKKESVEATLDSFPGKMYWDDLLALFQEYQLSGKITDNHITLSWT